MIDVNVIYLRLLTSRTAVYGPVRTVVWQGSAGDRRPYANQVPFEEVCVRIGLAGINHW